MAIQPTPISRRILSRRKLIREEQNGIYFRHCRACARHLGDYQYLSGSRGVYRTEVAVDLADSDPACNWFDHLVVRGPASFSEKNGITGSSRILPSSCDKATKGKNCDDNRNGRLITWSVAHRMKLPARRLVCRHSLWQGRVTQQLKNTVHTPAETPKPARRLRSHRRSCRFSRWERN